LARCSWSAWPVIPGSRGLQTISRKLATAGWAVAVIVGGLGLLAVIGAAAGTTF
jgi:hypothetical protein